MDGIGSSFNQITQTLFTKKPETQKNQSTDIPKPPERTPDSFSTTDLKSAQHFVCGAIGGGVEALVRTPIETLKTKIQLESISCAEAGKKIYSKSGIKGLYPHFSNTLTARFFQRGGLYIFVNSELNTVQKIGIGWLYELVVTSVTQATTVHSVSGRLKTTEKPLKLIINDFKKYGVSSVFSPWTAARNLTFLLVYNDLMTRNAEERKQSPIKTGLIIGMGSTLASHMFDPLAVFHQSKPTTNWYDAPKEYFSALKTQFARESTLSIIKRSVTSGVGSRVAAVGVGATAYTTVADLIKNNLQIR